MGLEETTKIIEALLFASPDPLTQVKVNNVLSPDAPNLKEVVTFLNEKYDKENHSFQIKSVAGGYQLVSKEEFEHYIRRMLQKTNRLTLSPAAMDSLAIIAYKQPIGRYEIEAIRGVDSSGVLKTLLNRNLIKIKGRDSGPGRPLLYQTTNIFLEYFGLNRLTDMPKLKEITELLEADPSLGEQITVFENEETHDDSKSVSSKSNS